MKNFLIILSSATIIIIALIPIVKKASSNRDLSQKVIDIKDTIAPQPTKILADNLPNYHLINTAFVAQAPEKNWDEPWQDACEEAALLTVHYYYQNESPSNDQIISDLKTLFQTETDLGFTRDINTSQMATVSGKLFNLRSEIITNPSIETIKMYLSKNIPVIVPANGKTLFKENSHFKSGGPWYHNLVILGYDENRQRFIVHDVGTQFGSYFHYSYNLLLESIHDFPSTGLKEDIDQGSKNILILLK